MTEEQIVEMSVAGLVLDPSTNAPIVILKDASGAVALPIWIGLAEATAIASALKKVELARPLTHDLLHQVILECGATVTRVVIVGLQENTFIANLEIQLADNLKVIDCRPSDAIALAVRTTAPIFVAQHVLDMAQVRLVAGEGEAGEGGEQSFTSIEKDKWAQILAAMDPDDFKYKM